MENKKTTKKKDFWDRTHNGLSLYYYIRKFRQCLKEDSEEETNMTIYGILVKEFIQFIDIINEEEKQEKLKEAINEDDSQKTELDHPLLAELLSICKNEGYVKALDYLNKWYVRKADVCESLDEILGKYSDEFEEVIGKIADLMKRDL